MSTGPLVAETLQTWRDAERLLDTLPPDSHDHEAARMLIYELRHQFVELTNDQDASDVRLRASRAAIDRAVATLARIAAKGLPLPGPAPEPGGAGGSGGSVGMGGSGGSGGPEPAAGGAG